MTDINKITSFILLLIASGCAMRIALCAIQMAADPDDAGTYKKRIRNAIVFGIAAVSAFGIKNVIVSYF
jgi:hypothetical protein